MSIYTLHFYTQTVYIILHVFEHLLSKVGKNRMHAGAGGKYLEDIQTDVPRTAIARIRVRILKPHR